MHKLKKFLLVLFCGILFPCYAACADVIDSNIYGDVLLVERDTHILPGAVIDVDAVNIVSSLLLENDANIYDIYVCNECDFDIRNSGTVGGTIYSGGNAHITQIIRGMNDMTRLDVDGNYTVFVDGANNILWNDLVGLAVDSGALVLRDSDIIMSDGIMDGEFVTWLKGNVVIKIPNGFSLSDNRLLLRNVKGEGTVVVDGAPGALHAYSLYVENDNLYINIVRETDYMKILGDWRGQLLNERRKINPNDALLRRLDNAQSMSDIYSIMSHSIAFNPGILMGPIRTLNKFMSGSIDDDLVGVLNDNVSVRPFYVVADDFNIYGANTQFVMRFADGVGLGASLYGAVADDTDDINAFSGRAFGGNVFANYLRDMWMLRGAVGATCADFSVPYIFDSGRIRDKAAVKSAYGVLDTGFVVGNFMPYVGGEYYGEQILNTSDSEILGRAGIESKFVLDSEIGKYEYKITAGANSVGDIIAGFGVGVVSYDDMIDGGMAINAIHDESGFATMLSATVKVLF